jgi:large exoprotein involved in heme utilization and adhesion
LTDSKISASVLDGNGGGGSVNIDPNAVILQHGQIIANSVFGPGGNINITTNLLLPDSASLISASSRFGQQGNIVIQSPISPASGKIIPLSQKPLVPTALLNQRCAALAAGNVSSFTVAGRDSLPAEPGGWVSSPLALSAPPADAALQASVDGVSEDRNEVVAISVRKIAPAGFLTQSFAGSTDCAS